MTQAKKRRWPFIGLFVLLLAAVLEAFSYFYVFGNNGSYGGIRSYILSEDVVPQYLAQPYINYTNHPGMPDPDGVSQINRMGLRHRKEAIIPKPTDTYRILFLGGSTTFGEVDTPEEAFPHIVQTQLNASGLEILDGTKTVECLNGGMGAATSAEIFTHYLLRYRYLDADMVVIHAGINDAFVYPDFPGYVYQPDYHTSKRVMHDMPEVTPALSMLCHSYTLASILIPRYFPIQFNSDFKTNDFFDYHSQNLWLNGVADLKQDNRYNAFYKNLEALITLLQSDGIDILLVSEVVEYDKMPSAAREMLEGGIELNTKLLFQLAERMNVPILRLEKDDFPPSLFIDNDGIHVDEIGEQKKAERITMAITKEFTAREAQH